MNSKPWLPRLILGASILSAATPLMAQNTNSTDVRGIVTDSSGAAIPGVNILVRDLDKGVDKTFTTDSAGLYDTGPLTPDHYNITFNSPGFEKFVRGPLTLAVGTVTINASLKVGIEQQTITVNEDVQLIEIESGGQSGTEKGDVMLNLPETGADWQNFVLLLPGVALGYGPPRPPPSTAMSPSTASSWTAQRHPPHEPEHRRQRPRNRLRGQGRHQLLLRHERARRRHHEP